MKLRIRNHFKGDRPASIDEQANILAFNIWQIALAGAKNLHQQDYEYQTDRQRVGVIEEYLIFLVHIADRMSYEHFDEAVRQQFISTLAADTARQVQRNTEEIMGSGDYKTPYFKKISERMPIYARGLFKNNQAGFTLLRIFGDQIQDIMEQSQVNKWAIAQIMDIDGPMMVKKNAAIFPSSIEHPRHRQ